MPTQDEPNRTASVGGSAKPMARPRGIYILPHLFTTAGLLAGFYAMVQAIEGNFGNAGVAILLAMVMDGLDGRIARWTNTASDFGKEYDSLVDVIAFGLAPALVVSLWTLKDAGKLGWLVAFLYLTATALRLARFNTQDTADKRYFLGLPCPSAAALLAASVWWMADYEFTSRSTHIFMLLLTFALALSMVSPIKYRSFKEFDPKERVSLVTAFLVAFVLVVVTFEPPVVLFLGFFVYFMSGPTAKVISKLRRRGGVKDKAVPEARPPSATDPAAMGTTPREAFDDPKSQDDNPPRTTH